MQADRYLTDKEKSAIELYFGLNADSAAEYNALKEQYPDALVGFEQNGQFEFYGEDARKICELTGGKLLERETALGTVLVTGFPREQWVYGHSSVFAAYGFPCADAEIDIESVGICACAADAVYFWLRTLCSRFKMLDLFC